MIDFKKKIAAGIVTGALLVSAFGPAAAFADTTVVIKDNGAGSTNNATVKNKKKVNVRQTNRTAVVNLTGVFQNTGGNTANNNTGAGDVNVDSGKAESSVNNNTTTGSNSATIDPCGCPDGNTTVRIRDNGAGSTNTVEVKNKSELNVNQTNETLVVNGTLVDQNTGGNHANNNTGDGGVDVNSGGATSTVTNTTVTGGNTLSP